MPERPTEAGEHNRQQIADLKAKGLSTRDIAKILDMSTQGVYWHLRRLAEKSETPA